MHAFTTHNHHPKIFTIIHNVWFHFCIKNRHVDLVGSFMSSHRYRKESSWVLNFFLVALGNTMVYKVHL